MGKLTNKNVEIKYVPPLLLNLGNDRSIGAVCSAMGTNADGGSCGTGPSGSASCETGDVAEGSCVDGDNATVSCGNGAFYG